ncbi:MerR family transcriptional regulator [Treponema brennaborense]|uniref:Transcriptional regulator, MerR family n=1 Tax=Treponema brennaborense (strain DSM 12168 / CIP 105900 / DD5/3) TaxID=906968 RepID=F4LJY8_TREBD|nr:MerR family transcriptional regulator [Treponema brennaborense]AEE16468.1 transcriptional regulator, MerR family [Treponema brennaborense DSM 12168]
MNEKELLTVAQVSEMTGISVRTLHYYDGIGLLAPSKVNESGCRFYDDKALETLQQILFFRELDFILKQYVQLDDASDYMRSFAAFSAADKTLDARYGAGFANI